MSALKDAAKTAYAGVKCAKEAFTTVTKRGWTLAAKKIGFEVTKKIGSEIANELVNIGIDKALIPQVESAIKELIAPKIIAALEKNKYVQTWIQIDADNRNATYQSLIKNLATEIIQNESKKGAFRRIAEGIGDGVLSQAGTLGKAYETLKYVNNLKEVVTYTDKFLKKLEKAIETEAKKQKTQESNAKINKDYTSKFKHHKSFRLKLISILIDQSKNVQEEGNADQDLTIHEVNNIDPPMKRDKSQKTTQYDDQPEEQVEVEKGYSNLNDVCISIAEPVSQKISSMINGNFIKPFTSSLVDKNIKKFTAGLNKRIEENINSFKCERRIEFFQNNDKGNRVPDEFKDAHKDKKVMEKVEQDIENFANGEKVGLQHLGSVSDACGCAIKVLDENGKLVRIIGDTSSGKIAEVLYKDGHYSLPNGEDPLGGSTKPNDCLFNVIAHQLGEKDPQKVNEMRSKTVDAMHKNIHILADQYADVKHLKQHSRKDLSEGGIVNPTRDEVINFLKGLTPEQKLKVQGAYSFKELTKLFLDLKRKGILDFHHEPPDSTYKGDRLKKLCIVLDTDDHKNLLSSKFPENIEYNKTIGKIISKDRENGFSNAILIGCLDIQLTSLRSGNGEYGHDMNSLVDSHFKDGKISESQAKNLKEKIQTFPTISENFTEMYLETHSDAFKHGEGAYKAFVNKVNENTDTPKQIIQSPKDAKKARAQHARNCKENKREKSQNREE